MSHIFRIIWPEKRDVSAQKIAQWYADAVANDQCPAGETDIMLKAKALQSAGLITLSIDTFAGIQEAEKLLHDASRELLHTLRDVVARIGKTPVRMDLTEAHALLKRFKEIP